MAKDRGANALKYAVFSFVIIFAFFASVEVLTRIYFAVKNKKPYYLLYGIMSTEKINAILKHGKIDPDESLARAEKRKEAEGTGEYYITPIEMRYRKIPYEKPSGTCRIIAVGGSTTWGQHAEDDETYPCYLEGLLNDPHGKSTGRTFEVINAGVCGARIEHMDNYMKKDLIHLHPDMVIIFTGWNETARSLKTGHTVLKPNKFVIWLMNRSLFFVAVREKIAFMLHKHAEYAWYRFKKGASPVTADLESPCFEEYERNLTEFIRYLQRENVKAVLIRPPYRMYHDHPTEYEGGSTTYYWKPILDKTNSIIEKVSIDTGTPLIDCESPFNKIDKTPLFSDIMHLTPEGNKIFARIIFDHLKGEGLVEI